MLRARPINEVRARAERIQLLCVFCGFGSRRSMAQSFANATCALHCALQAACCSLWQGALQRVRQQRDGQQRCDACAIQHRRLRAL